MKIEITLTGTGGELDSQTVIVPASDDPDEAVSLAIHSVIEPWRLSPGDVITIKEI